MRIAFITSGAAGMFCGSCLRDNALVTALREIGHDAVLIPTYTPIRTDELDVSEGKIFYGGINVYLEQQRWSGWLFRHTPRWVDWLLNRPALIQWAAGKSVNADYAGLAELTLSMLRGEHGNQRKELEKLVAWLRDEVRPEVVVLSNVMLSALAGGVKQALGVPVLTTLQGDDIFLDALPERFRGRCLEEVRRNDQQTDGYFSTSRSYADQMAGYLGIDRGKIAVVYPGINLKGYGDRPDRAGEPPTVGYFARICPEKGFDNLVEAFIRLRKTPGAPPARLKASGWMGEHHKPFFAAQLGRLRGAGLLGDFEHVESPTHDDKVRFLQSIDVLSVPTTYREPKGLYVLEAWAGGAPVVQPRHGSFPELIEATGGGLLTEPGDPDALADGLRRVLGDPGLAADLGRKGRAGVHERFTARRMAEETASVLRESVS